MVRNLRGLLLLMLCGACSSCAHRRVRPVVQSLVLEEKTGYALLVPGAATANAAGYQTTSVPLLAGRPASAGQSSSSCAIAGEVFSLNPVMAEGVLRWTIRSPSEQGWAASATKYDIHAEWSQFIHELLRLQDQSCFPANLPFFTIRRLIAESMPLPAAEVAFFLYSFGGTGYVDLVPGMELKLERPLREKELSSTHGKLTSVEAVYRVVSSSGRNVGLRQVSAMGRKEASISREQKQSIFDLPSLLRDKPALRLFLAEAGDHDNLPGIIAATSTATEMPELTTAIVHEPRSCPRSIPAGEACVFFNGTAVNLLSSIEINGKQELLPFGTSLGYVVDVRAKGNALTSFSLKRQLATGDYAEVKFAPTLDAIQQIVLLPGDLLRWK